MFLEH